MFCGRCYWTWISKYWAICRESSRPLLQAVHAKKWFGCENTSEFKARMTSLHYKNWSQKAIHGQFVERHQLMFIINGIGHGWSHHGCPLKLRVILFAAQEQAITINVMSNEIFKFSLPPFCRLCCSADKTIDHLICSGLYIAQTQYKRS